MAKDETRRMVTHHCSECGAEVAIETALGVVLGPEECEAHPGAEIKSIATLLAGDGTPLGVDVRVEGGRYGTEDYDTGRVVEVVGDGAMVAWDSAITSYSPASALRAVRS